jgi:hypothetical protein
MNYPSDFIEHGYLSSCCGANVIHDDLCMECGEHCGLETEKEETIFESEFGMKFNPNE